MVIRKVKKHGIENISYSGEIGNTLVRVIFENGSPPVEGDIEVTVGKMVTKNRQNFYYVKSYQRVGL